MQLSYSIGMVLVLSAGLAPRVGAQQLIGLGNLGTTDWTQANGISGDGGIILGFSSLTAPLARTPVRWTFDEAGQPVIENLGPPTGFADGAAFGASEDGNVVIGSSIGGAGSPRAFTWSDPGPSTTLSIPSGWSQVRGRALTRDGQWVVGSALIQGTGVRAVRWQPGGTPTLLPSDGNPALAHAVDGTGRIYGSMFPSPGVNNLVRWNTDLSIEVLVVLPTSADTESYANWASADGTVVQGSTAHYGTTPYQEAWLWSASAGFTTITPIPGHISTLVSGLSGDGSIVTGYGFDNFNSVAPFVWTAGGGTQPAAEYFAAAGVDLEGWTLGFVNDVSDDGMRFVGVGLNPVGRNEAYLIDLAPLCAGDFNEDGELNSSDFFAFLGAFFGGSADADVDGSGEVDSSDFFGFLGMFFAGC